VHVWSHAMASGIMSKPLKLRIELVPKPLFEHNLRGPLGLGKARWDKLRHSLMEVQGRRCVVCSSDAKLHGHEVWKYTERPGISTALLLRVEIVCIDCHDIHHFARTTNLWRAGVITPERYNFLRRHFRKVNRCRQEQFDNHFLQSLRVWDRRSRRKWKVDWGPFQDQITAAGLAREKWAASRASM
jgi:hypothetical protein